MSELDLRDIGYRVYQCGEQSYMVRLPNRNLIAADFPSTDMAWHVASLHHSKQLRNVKVFPHVGGERFD